MQYRTLGRTGLTVSEIGLGAVQFGMPYGIPDREGRLPVLTEGQSLEILWRAFTEGINFIDTARDYGDSEAIVGRALRHRQETIYIATKLVSLSEEMTDDEMSKAIRDSIEQSRRMLNRETIDLLQVHNATETLLKREVIPDLLDHARTREWIRCQGVTTYGVGAPALAIEQGWWDTVQVEFNVFNQRTREIFDEAQARDVGLIIRSAMLKGAMAAQPEDVPSPLREVHRKAQDVPRFFGRRDLSVAQTALLYVLSHAQVGTVLSGVVSVGQLLENLEASGQPHFSTEQLEEARELEIRDPALTDPRRWDFVHLPRP